MGCSKSTELKTYVTPERIDRSARGVPSRNEQSLRKASSSSLVKERESHSKNSSHLDQLAPGAKLEFSSRRNSYDIDMAKIDTAPLQLADAPTPRNPGSSRVISDINRALRGFRQQKFENFVNNLKSQANSVIIKEGTEIRPSQQQQKKLFSDSGKNPQDLTQKLKILKPKHIQNRTNVQQQSRSIEFPNKIIPIKHKEAPRQLSLLGVSSSKSRLSRESSQMAQAMVSAKPTTNSKSKFIRKNQSVEQIDKRAITAFSKIDFDTHSIAKRASFEIIFKGQLPSGCEQSESINGHDYPSEQVKVPTSRRSKGDDGSEDRNSIRENLASKESERGSDHQPKSGQLTQTPLFGTDTLKKEVSSSNLAEVFRNQRQAFKQEAYKNRQGIFGASSFKRNKSTAKQDFLPSVSLSSGVSGAPIQILPLLRSRSVQDMVQIAVASSSTPRRALLSAANLS